MVWCRSQGCFTWSVVGCMLFIFNRSALSFTNNNDTNNNNDRIQNVRKDRIFRLKTYNELLKQTHSHTHTNTHRKCIINLLESRYSWLPNGVFIISFVYKTSKCSKLHCNGQKEYCTFSCNNNGYLLLISLFANLSELDTNTIL